MRVSIVAAIVASVALSSGTAAQPPNELVGIIRATGKAVANAVVWLEGGAPAARRNRAVLHQRSLKFAPQVLAVSTGTVVDFPNDDRVFHNVFSFRDGKRFDLGIYPVATTSSSAASTSSPGAHGCRSKRASGPQATSARRGVAAA